MALSQIQCLDDNHVNWRMNESKPEFFYSEDQRLAIEELIKDGREAFDKYIKEHEMRPFLSEQELERVSRSIEVYKPGSEHHKLDPTIEDDGAISLQYWPDRSDISIPELDLGWPDCAAYRGVTRVTVYAQPPVDGHTHIKEVVRKAIAQAQKVIAVVMDVFTDVDIFKDLLDAGFKRKVAVYIIIEQAAVPNFLSMCERANMHGGHLKYLRVRCCGGLEFFTRSANKLRGSLSQRFMFVDGDRAISGSYSYTWTASRLDRNLITALTGQAVETFDKMFRELYPTSRGVNLSKLPLAEIPEPEPTPAPAPAPVPSAEVARKRINPKYALVSTDPGRNSSENAASAKNSTSQNPLPLPPKRTREPVEAPPIHPGLQGLPRAELIQYLPVWPEPDPPSDVIGFINIRDTSRPVQAHLMRSQLFETSQAIRFKDPLMASPEKPLPDKASPRARPGPADASRKPCAPESARPQGEAPPAPDPKGSDPGQTPGPAARPSEPSPRPAPQPSGPPVPKPRTLQLVLNPGPGEAEVCPMQKVQNPPQQAREETSSSEEYGEPPDEPGAGHPPENARAPPPADPETDRPDGGRTGRRDSDRESITVTYSQSLKDKDESSTASEDYYECSDQEQAEPVSNGRTGSGRYGDHNPSTDAINVMARFSQSLVDLRSEECTEPALQNQLNANRRDRERITYQMSPRGPGRAAFDRTQAKVVIAKPGAHHRPSKSGSHIIGGHRYWQGNLANVPAGLGHERPGRSPRRGPLYKTGGLGNAAHSHSPANRGANTTPPSARRGSLPYLLAKGGHARPISGRGVATGPVTMADRMRRGTRKDY